VPTFGPTARETVIPTLPRRRFALTGYAVKTNVVPTVVGAGVVKLAVVEMAKSEKNAAEVFLTAIVHTMGEPGWMTGSDVHERVLATPGKSMTV